MAAALVLLLAVPLAAADGAIEINHVDATAGNVSTGDTPGYPVTIADSGFYRLTGDLTLPDVNTDGVEITADHVTLDLNGFAIRGPVTCSGSGPLLSCSASGTGSGLRITGNHVTVRDGTVTGAGGGGVNVRGTDVTVEDVRAVANALFGIYGEAPADRGPQRVVGCTAALNGGPGIATDLAAILIANLATGNLSHGLVGGDGSVVHGNTASGNGGHGIQASTAVVTGNTATSNNLVGLDLSDSGYAENRVDDNTSGTVSGTGTEIGVNLCNGDTTCP